MKTSSPYCRSEMRPEYLAEFEAAGVPPYSQVSFPATVPDVPVVQPRTRKVIVDVPRQFASADPVGANLASIVAGAALVFILAFFLPMLFFFAFTRGIMKASRRGRRRSW